MATRKKVEGKPRKETPARKGKGGGGITHAGDRSLPRLVTSSEGPVLVDFWAPWCGPCVAMGPELEKLAGELAGTVKVVKVNVDRSRQVAEKCGIEAIPTLILFDGERPPAALVGMHTARQIGAWVRKQLGKHKPRAAPGARSREKA